MFLIMSPLIIILFFYLEISKYNIVERRKGQRQNSNRKMETRQLDTQEERGQTNPKKDDGR